MSIYTNSSANTVKVLYKLSSKQYNNKSDQGNAANLVDDATSTFYPWEEIEVTAGASTDLGDSSVVKVVELGSVTATPTRVGATGDVENTSEHDMRVYFKIDGKSYNNKSDQGNANNPVDTEDSTYYPWEEVTVPVGQKFNSVGTTVVRTSVLGIAPPDAPELPRTR